MPASNELSQVMADLPHQDLKAATSALRQSILRHPLDSTCDCPTMEALAVLYERGYRLTKGTQPA